MPSCLGPAHKNANNFAPNEFREVVNLSSLAVYKGSNTTGKSNGATVRKLSSKREGVNDDGNMDQGALTSTSDVSLPKDSEQLCWVNKLQLGN